MSLQSKRSLAPASPLGTAPRWLCLFAVPTGASFLAYLLFTIDLRLGLAIAVPALVAGFAVVWRALPNESRHVLRARVAVGARAGLVATLAYDSSKYLFARFSGTAENPFGAVPKFGALLLGEGAGDVANTLAGASFHLVNGVTFGVAFAVLATRPTWGKGIAFGLFLELFQLALYPGWLSPKSYAELASLTAFGHVVYGVTLGTATAMFGRRSRLLAEVRA